MSWQAWAFRLCCSNTVYLGFAALLGIVRPGPVAGWVAVGSIIGSLAFGPWAILEELRKPPYRS